MNLQGRAARNARRKRGELFGKREGYTRKLAFLQSFCLAPRRFGRGPCTAGFLSGRSRRAWKWVGGSGRAAGGPLALSANRPAWRPEATSSRRALCRPFWRGQVRTALAAAGPNAKREQAPPTPENWQAEVRPQGKHSEQPFNRRAQVQKPPPFSALKFPFPKVRLPPRRAPIPNFQPQSAGGTGTGDSWRTLSLRRIAPSAWEPQFPEKEFLSGRGISVQAQEFPT